MTLQLHLYRIAFVALLIAVSYGRHSFPPLHFYDCRR
jgi:hypothetical protein